MCDSSGGRREEDWEPGQHKCFVSWEWEISHQATGKVRELRRE